MKVGVVTQLGSLKNDRLNEKVTRKEVDEAEWQMPEGRNGVSGSLPYSFLFQGWEEASLESSLCWG